ncbi:MAG: NAD-dependent deacylase [Myxococcales bacterium]|nr:NAD-dependent deacylase [Myxococcales bacterium]
METLRERLSAARSILFITGAGISADSGLPTYRGLGGLYEEKVTDEGIPIEEALSAQTFARDPALTWKYIGEIEANTRGAKPNPAHAIIAEAERAKPRVWTLTQNIDGLHRAAGSQNLIEIHGDVHRLRCLRCGARRRLDDFSSIEIPPRCPKCGAIERPEVVLFGEMLPQDDFATLERELTSGFDAVISIGTTSVFPYIAQPVYRARMKGALTVEVNPGHSQVSDIVEYRLRMRAATALEALRDALLSSR